MPTIESNRILYNFAKEFLLSHLPLQISSSDLEKYYQGEGWYAETLSDVFIVFIQCAQDYYSMPNVIRFAERRDQIGAILDGFNYLTVASKSEQELYDSFLKYFNNSGTKSKNNSWYKWSCAIVDSARFLTGFADCNDFDLFVQRFNYNADTRMALPLLISTKIRGIGFALACNVLKELGYEDYPKPDVHMIDVCEGLGLSDNNPYNVFHAIVKMAKDNNVSPFEVDRTLWLICSGNYYMNGIKDKPRKKEFISEAKSLLETL